MYSQSDLEDAVAGGAVTAEQAASLRNFVAGRNAVPTADEEHARILLGFNDIYVFCASILLFVGLGWLAGKIELDSPMPSPIVALVVTLAAWGLAEYFSRRQRLALPGITYAITVVYGVYFTLMFTAMLILEPPVSRETANVISAVCALIAAGAAFLYWKRFKEPISFALGATMVALAILSLLGATMGSYPSGDMVEIAMLILGLLIFVYAMYWDSKDVCRVTARADVGFWLHWTAAGFVVIALAALLDLFEGSVSAGMSILAIVLFVLLTLVALAVGRRVWVLGASILFGVGLYHLIQGPPPEVEEFDSMGSYGGGSGGYGGDIGGYYSSMQDNSMMTLLIVGIVLVLIGMFWAPIRRMMVALLPAGLCARLPAAGQPAATAAQTFD